MRSFATVLLACLAAATAAPGSVRSRSSPERPWMDASLPVYDRVDALMQKMTLEERCRQTWAVHNWKPEYAHEWANASIGSIKLSAFPNTTAAGVLQYRNQLMRVFVDGSRLGIPPSFHQETLLSAAPNATNIPMPVTLGSSWNTDLVRRANAVVSAELRAVGGDVSYAPEVNLYTDPRFGRLQEGFSSDATLASELGVSAAIGVQSGVVDGSSNSAAIAASAATGGPGSYLPSSGAAALAKHFVAYGPARGGQNVGATIATPTELVDRFAAPWRAMVRRAGLRALMPSHQQLFDVPVHGNAWAGQVLLRGDPAAGGLEAAIGLNFSGFSTSDCSDIGALIQWGIAADSEHAAVLGMGATVDMDNMCATNPDDGAWTYTKLQDAVQAGLVPECSVDAAARRVLAQKFAAGLFDTPYVNSSGLSVVGSPQHLAVAYEAAVEGHVLLKNTPTSAADASPPLPLEEANNSAAIIALIGPLTDCPAAQDGRPSGGLCEAQQGYLGKPQHQLGDLDVPTVADAARAWSAEASSALNWARQGSVGGGFTLRVELGGSVRGACDDSAIAAAQQAAAGADAAVVVVGDDVQSCAEWGDKSSLTLPGCQARLLSAVTRAQPRPTKIVVALVNGRPYTLEYNGTDLTEEVDAVVVAWRGGQTGGQALWDVLTGRRAPTGRLPQPWLRSVGQVNGPATDTHVNGKWTANTRGPTYQPQDQHPFDPYTESDATPLYPLGYGLSYGDTNVKYEKLTVDCPVVVASSDAVACTANVTLSNAGSDSAIETVQLYATPHPGVTHTPRAWQRLAAFAKVEVRAGGGDVTVSMAVRADAMAVTRTATSAPLGSPSLAGSQRVVPGGTYSFVAGTNRLDAALTVDVSVPESTLLG